MEEEFEPVGFGMWKDRSEMGNSSKWVAELREKEWSKMVTIIIGSVSSSVKIHLQQI